MGRWRPVCFAGTIVGMSKYQPGLYKKGDKASTASSASEAVALVFQGYKLVEEEAPQAETPDEPQGDDDGDEPVSALDGADPDFDEGSPSEENTSPELEANQSASAYTF